MPAQQLLFRVVRAEPYVQDVALLFQRLGICDEPGLEDVFVVLYDANGNTVAKTDALGNAETFAYDAMGRVKAKTGALGAATSWFVNKSGM